MFLVLNCNMNFRLFCRKLLLNDSHFIEKDEQRIALIGVENWGSGFRQSGDLNKALKKVDSNDFKILMSHDPSHWEAKVLPHPFKIQLTLSGHTHGMQFGIEIPGWIKWSPVKWRYKHWAGIYEDKKQLLNDIFLEEIESLEKLLRMKIYAQEDGCMNSSIIW